MNSPARPLVGLIVPVWGDDDLAAELVERVQIDPALGELVIKRISAAPPPQIFFGE